MLEFSVQHAEIGAYNTWSDSTMRRVRGITVGKHFLGRALLQSLAFLSSLRYSSLSCYIIAQGVPRAAPKFFELCSAILNY